MDINRPKASKKKIHSKNEFELCYLRHQYLRRVKFNPTEEQMQPFMTVITNLARHTFYTYKNLFKSVGFELEDIVNIAKVHLVSFLGLFSLEQMPQKYNDFVTKHYNAKGRDPSESDILSKEKANLTIFMKQRMEDVVRVCRQKARNIKGMPTEEYYVFYGPKRPPKDLRKLLEDHETLGYRKLDMASLKTIKKRQQIKHTDPFKFAGNWYITVFLEKRQLSIVDFAGADMDPYDSIHNKNPEDLLIEEETEENFRIMRESYEGQSAKGKRAILKGFIAKNKGNPTFREELKIARQFLKDLRD